MGRASFLALRAALVAVAGALSSSPDDVRRAFEQFLADYGKNYIGEELEARFRAFATNYELIREENAKGHSYELGVNEFSDMTDEEFALTHYGYRPPPKGAEWAGLAHLGTHRRSNVSLREEVDWVRQGAVTPVKAQGSCGSCWAFSSTGALEGAWKIASGQLVPLSEQQLVDCSGGYNTHGCHGGWMESAFQYVKDRRSCTEESYPYRAAQGDCQAPTCTPGILHGHVAGYRDVAPNDEQALMEAVAQQPVSISLKAGKVFRHYTKGVLARACQTDMNHAVLVVGYGTLNGLPYWLVKNSWGPSWGLHGYVRVLRSGGAGECGMNQRPSYPVVHAMSAGSSAVSHYEMPPCQEGEKEASVQGSSDMFCAPECSNATCPTDVPEGTTAKPQCVAQDPVTGYKYCALVCDQAADCPQGANCLKSGPTGVCTYPIPENRPEVPAFLVDGTVVSI